MMNRVRLKLEEFGGTYVQMMTGAHTVHFIGDGFSLTYAIINDNLTLHSSKIENDASNAKSDDINRFCMQFITKNFKAISGIANCRYKSKEKELQVYQDSVRALLDSYGDKVWWADEIIINVPDFISDSPQYKGEKRIIRWK